MTHDLPPIETARTVIEWGILMCLPGYPDDGNVLTYGGEDKARAHADIESGDVVVSRTVDTWSLEDGSTVVRTSPWSAAS